MLNEQKRKSNLLSWTSRFSADIPAKLTELMEKDKKLRILYLYKILWEKTDEEHSLGVSEIISELERYGIKVERKTVYKDIEALIEFGVDVIVYQNGKNYYYIGNREFELAELKLLVDSVQSAKFIEHLVFRIHSGFFFPAADQRVIDISPEVIHGLNALYSKSSGKFVIIFRNLLSLL